MTDELTLKFSALIKQYKINNLSEIYAVPCRPRSSPSRCMDLAFCMSVSIYGVYFCENKIFKFQFGVSLICQCNLSDQHYCHSYSLNFDLQINE